MLCSARRAGSVLTAGILLCGCGRSSSSNRPQPVPASGHVTYKNAPIEGATVSFLGDGQSQPAIAMTDADGNFVLTTNRAGDGAVPGDHRVTVTKILGSASPTASRSLSMDEAVEEWKKNQKPTAPKVLSLVPEKYAKPETSGLQFTVKAGEKNHFDLPLTD